MPSLDLTHGASALRISLESQAAVRGSDTARGRPARIAARAWPSVLLHVLLHALVFACLAWWSWRKWPDPITDFGRELYVPWQLAQGKVLYRDVASLFGPLSPYVNAALFRAFGVSLTVLIVSNLAILAATLAGIHYLVRTAAGARVATAVTLWTMAVFGFGQYVTVGNYNFVSPYSHEATHGFALGVLVLVSVHHALRRGRRKSLALAGACFGMVLLTKPEIALAVAVAVASGMIAAAAIEPKNRRFLGIGSALFCLAALAAPAAFLGYFSAHMPPADALRAVAGAWRPAWAPGVATGAFYELVSGLDRPVANLARMLGTFGAVAVFVVAVVGVARRVNEGPEAREKGPVRRVAWLVGLVLLLVITPWAAAFPPALPLTTVAALVGILALLAGHRRDRDMALRLIAPLMWASFALALLPKMLLNARIFHYGFYLALPAASTLIASLAWLLPEFVGRRYSEATALTVRRLAMLMVAAAFVPYLVLANIVYARHHLPLGAGGDRFYASDGDQLWQGAATRESVKAIHELTSPQDTVAVLPEGIMLNYLSRRESPLHVINLMPPELAAFGERQVLDDLRTRRPRLVLLVQRDMAEYAYPAFGSDARYGHEIVSWIRQHYEPVRQILPDQGTLESRVTVLALRAEP